MTPSARLVYFLGCGVAAGGVGLGVSCAGRISVMVKVLMYRLWEGCEVVWEKHVGRGEVGGDA